MGVRLERTDPFGQQSQHFIGEQDLVPLPGGIGIKRHVLDEADFAAGLAGELSERHHFVFRQSADGDGVDLDRFEADLFRGFDPLEHLFVSVPPGDLSELFRREGIQTDVEPAEASVEQRLRLFGQQDAVGRHADVIDAGNPGQPFDEAMQIPADEWFASGEPQLVDAQRNDRPHEPFDLFERQQILAIHELHVVRRHAVKAPDVAAISDADPQVVMPAAEGIDEGQFAKHRDWISHQGS